jgi:capsular polysaccharide biosynthesis protein
MASFGLAFALALLLELRDPVIATAKGVEALAGVPVLGVMPKVS